MALEVVAAWVEMFQACAVNVSSVGALLCSPIVDPVFYNSCCFAFESVLSNQESKLEPERLDPSRGGGPKRHFAG